MFSWAGFIVIAIGLALVVMVVRAIIDLVNWLIEVFVQEPREMARIRELQKAKKLGSDASGTPSPGALQIPPNTFCSPSSSRASQAPVGEPSIAEPNLAKTKAALIHASEGEENRRQNGGREDSSRERKELANTAVNEEKLT